MEGACATERTYYGRSARKYLRRMVCSGHETGRDRGCAKESVESMKIWHREYANGRNILVWGAQTESRAKRAVVLFSVSGELRE